MNDVVEQEEPKKRKMEPAESRITFARPNDLKKLLKQLEKLTPDSITALTEVLQDTNADPKLRVDVAKTLLQTRINVSESIAKDQMMRSVAEARLIMAQQPKLPKQVTSEEDEEDKPKAIFIKDVILDVNKCTNF